MTIKQASDSLHNKKISAVELTKGLLTRIEEKEPSVSALNTVCADTALKEAEASEKIKSHIEDDNPGIEGLDILFEDGVVSITGRTCRPSTLTRVSAGHFAAAPRTSRKTWNSSLAR